MFFCLVLVMPFVRVCLFVPCGHLLGKGWPLGSSLWCLIVSLSLSHWYPGSGVVLDCIDSWSLHPYLLSHSLPVSRPPQKALPMKRITSITGNREHQGVRQLNTAKPNVDTANSKSLFNLSYNTPNTNEPATYLEKIERKKMEPVFSKRYKLACAQGGGTLIFSYIRRLESFLGFKIWISFFGRFSVK